VPKIAVIGLGRFGMSLARSLAASGAQVLAVDRAPQLVNEIKDDVDIAVRLDSTDRAALQSQELDTFDVCVVSIGENFEAALLTTVMAKQMGVPRIICRAQTTFHAEIFRQIGADQVVQPEMEIGEQLARKLANPHLRDLITLAEGYSLIEIPAPKVFHGKTLQELELRQRYGVNLIAVKQLTSKQIDGKTEQYEKLIPIPRPGEPIEPGDVWVLVGSDESLAALPKE
jgi:trk system potassium uptake protein TrkA